MIKRLFPEDHFVQRVETIGQIPVAVALHYLKCEDGALWAGMFLHDVLEFEEGQVMMQKTFGVSVSDYRKLLLSPNPEPRLGLLIRIWRWFCIHFQRKELSV